jgi:hypothetical protein
MSKHIVKIEDFKDYEHQTILASTSDSPKKIIQKTYLRQISPGRHELVNVIEVWRLGKLITSTSHLQLAIAAYNKI